MRFLAFLYSTLLSTQYAPYSIEIGKNICNVALHVPKSFIISNPIIYQIYNKSMKLDKNIILVPDGESYKSIETISKIIEKAQLQGCDKHSQFVALGGGVIGDLTGLAANLYMRGIKFTSIPTTLMSMIDSSIGSKNGVNNMYAKNVMGTFYHPSKVIIDIAFLETLPQREYQSGIAEMIKCAIIGDSEFFSWLEKNIDSLLTRDESVLLYAIEKTCALKLKIVNQDPFDNVEIRAQLNLGHTFGHAIETLTNLEKYLHGEAVAIGICLASELSYLEGKLDSTSVQRIKNLLTRAQLPTTYDKVVLKSGDMMRVMKLDKKNNNQVIKFVLPSEIGSAFVTTCQLKNLRKIL